MSKRITYFLGAGASANAVPIVNKFNDQVSSFINLVYEAEIKDERFGTSYSGIDITKKTLRDEFVKESRIIIEKINSSHTTVDNYARMLYLTKQNRDLRRLKALLQSYLLWIHFTNSYDKRYDLFLATMLNFNGSSGELVLPSNIQIITWNYDIQFEIAAEKYFQTDVLDHLQRDLRTTSISGNLNLIKNSNEFCIIRLNGDALAWYERETPRTLNYQISILGKDKIAFIEELLFNYYWLAYIPHGNISGINYAWEDNKHARQIREIAFEKASSTEILVIIGYSFPTFNRAIDRKLISSMQNLKKVYIQTMKEAMTEVTDRFKALLSDQVEVIPIVMTSGQQEFYIPFEYIG